MKTLTLDYKKWRCGSIGSHHLGDGETMLLNDYGFMCCLGQFSLQLGVLEEDLLNKSRPDELPKPIELLTTTGNVFESSAFSEQAIYINDDHRTTPSKKIEQLTALCLKHGYELNVINKD